MLREVEPEQPSVSVREGSHSRSLAWYACLAACLGGLFSMAAGRLAWVWIPFDLLNHFVLHFAVLAAAGIAGLLAGRRRLLVATIVLLAGLVAIPTWPRLLAAWDRPGAPPADTRVIRVMSLNTWLSNPDWRAVVREIERQDPDILTLIEFGEEKAALPQALVDRYPYQTDCLAQPYCHMALLSKFPFRDAESRTQWTGPPQIAVHYGPELANLSVIGIHTLRPPYFRSQLKQVQALAAQVARIGGTRIVMGDFNATPFSRMLATFAGESGLERITWLPSWPARFGPLPQIAIDHIFISSDLAVVGFARVGDNAGSDHYPVIADIRLPVPLPERTAVGALSPSR